MGAAASVGGGGGSSADKTRAATRAAAAAAAARAAARVEKDPWVAVERGDLKTVAMAVDTGAVSVWSTNFAGDTLLSIATREGYFDLVEYLVNDARSIETPKTPPWDGRTPVVVRADPGHRNLAMKTPLHFAVTPAEERKCERGDDWDYERFLEPDSGEFDQMQIVGMLLEAGADVNLRTARGETALLLITRMSWTSGCDFLLRRGADVHLKDYRGISPILAAAMTGDAACMRRLLQAGADTEHRDRKGNTPLILATSKNNVDCVHLLTATKCKVDAKNFVGVSAYVVACQRQSVEIAQHLLEHGATRSKLAERALTTDKAEQLRVAASALSWGRGVENPLTFTRADEQSLRALTSMPIFGCLSARELAVLTTEVCRYRYVEPGETIVARGTAAKHLEMAFLLQGTLRADEPTPGGKLPFKIIHENDEMPVLFAHALVCRETAPAQVIATGGKSVKLLTLSPTALSEFVTSIAMQSRLLSTTADAELQGLRLRLRNAVATRFVEPHPPAWCMFPGGPPYKPTSREVAIMKDRSPGGSWVPPVPTPAESVGSGEHVDARQVGPDGHGVSFKGPGRGARPGDVDFLADIDRMAAAAAEDDDDDDGSTEHGDDDDGSDGGDDSGESYELPDDAYDGGGAHAGAGARGDSDDDESVETGDSA